MVPTARPLVPASCLTFEQNIYSRSVKNSSPSSPTAKIEKSDIRAPNGALLEILVALSDGDSIAADVLSVMDAWAGGAALPLGSFYRHLERGVGEGWIEITDCSPSSGRGRPARRYRLTREGRQAASSALGRMERLTEFARATGFLPEEAQ